MVSNYTSQLAMELQKGESETLELRRSLEELRRKFVQLERAFETNLQWQRQREAELNRMKGENHELRNVNHETLNARANLNCRLTEAMEEKDHWKYVFLRQKGFIERCQMDRDEAVDSIKRECEDILKATRETTEKHFQQLIDLYKSARDEKRRIGVDGASEGHVSLQSNSVETRAEMYQNFRGEYERRTFKLANLLETLKRFDVSVSLVCERVAEALKNLTERENLFEESLNSLRQLTWTTENREKNNPELILLRQQNFVLKEVVRNLKRKAQTQPQPWKTIAERDDEREKHFPQLVSQSSQNVNDNVQGGQPHSDAKYPPPRMKDDKGNECEYDKRGKILCIESHVNGVSYEEYTLRISSNSEMKIKCPVAINGGASPLIKMDFVDSEIDYDNGRLDGMVILLKNIYASVSVKQTGITCATQTAKMKTRSRFTQTPFSGMNNFPGPIAGVRMLNTEKRAIEKSLCNLERTVASLKLDASDGQARKVITMINSSCTLDNGQ